MNRGISFLFLAIPAATAALSVACGGRVADDHIGDLASRADSVTTLEFTRTDSTSGAESMPPLLVALDDQTRVRDLYSATLALPDLASASLAGPSCTDGDVLYHLVFRSGSTVVMQADEQPDGCESVTISGVPYSLVAGPAYWARLSAGLGVPESIMYPGR